MIYAIGIIAVILGVALDQYTKYLAITHLQGNPVSLIDGVFELRYLENRGAAFGLFQNQQFFFKDQRGLPNLIYRTPLNCI